MLIDIVRTLGRGAVALLGLKALTATTVAAQSATVTGTVTRRLRWRRRLPRAPLPSEPVTALAGPGQVDGRLDEEGWTGVRALEPFRQVDPDAGAPARARTARGRGSGWDCTSPRA